MISRILCVNVRRSLARYVIAQEIDGELVKADLSPKSAGHPNRSLLETNTESSQILLDRTIWAEVDLNGQVGHAQVDGAFIASGNGRMGKIVSDDLPVGYIWPLDKSPEEQDEEGMIAFNPLDVSDVQLVRTRNTRYSFDLIEEVSEDGEVQHSAININRLKKIDLARLNAEWDTDQDFKLKELHYNLIMN